MTWPEAMIALANVAQVVLLAWLASRQQQVKRDLSSYNGTTNDRLDAIAVKLEDSEPTSTAALERQD